MYVTVNGPDDLVRALRVFSKMVKKEGLVQEIKNRRYFMTKAEKRELKRKEGIRRKKREEKKEARQKKYEE